MIDKSLKIPVFFLFAFSLMNSKAMFSLKEFGTKETWDPVSFLKNMCRWSEIII